MKKGKLIVIEGTDCSGKETQTKLLIKHLESEGKKVISFSFPMYDTPTGKIIGGPFLGKEYICDGWFPEGAPAVNGKVASLYYAADRFYNINKINEYLEQDYVVILDRYTYSNMAHQGGKLQNKEDRIETYRFIEKLEFELLGLPRADAVIFLFMPVEKAREIRAKREESLDQNERDENHLKLAQQAYIEISELYNFKTINCAKDDVIRSIEDISNEVIEIYNSL